MRRHESKRGEIVAACHCEGRSPENHQVGVSRWVANYQQATVRQARWRGCCTLPGSQTSSSLTLRTRGNHGDPGGSTEGAGQPLTSLNSKKEVESAGKSEPPIRAMKSGNADGAKGWRYWDNGSTIHAPTPSGLCA